MASTRATGKPRRPNRIARSGASIAGIAALAATGVVTPLAGSAAAAGGDAPAAGPSGLRQAIVMGDSLAETIGHQARAQRDEADAAAVKAKAEAVAKNAAEARKAAKERAKERTARARERKRLNSYVLPVDSYVSTPYKSSGGSWSSGSHTGVDFHAASGTAVRSVGAGEVVEAGWDGSYGNNIVVKMNDGTYTQYGHLSSIDVSVGQSVGPGRKIARSGATGNTSGPHLHFEARTGPDYGADTDPVGYLRSHGLSL